jgi:hypothetical protein
MNPRIPQIIADLVRFESELSATTEPLEIEQLLSNVKLYAAELYLETDLEIIARSKQNELVPKLEMPVEASDSNENKIPIVEALDNSSERVFKPVFEDEIDTQSNINPIVELVPNQVDEEATTANINIQPVHTETIPINDPQERVENVPKDLQFLTDSEQDLDDENDDFPTKDKSQIPDLFSQEIPEVSDNKDDGDEKAYANAHFEQRATEILGMFSFSRRFEFGNFLFAGDMKLFAVFITEMLAATDADHREEVFDTWYQERQWSRRDESANDLKRNLKKML